MHRVPNGPPKPTEHDLPEDIPDGLHRSNLLKGDLAITEIPPVFKCFLKVGIPITKRVDIKSYPVIVERTVVPIGLAGLPSNPSWALARNPDGLNIGVVVLDKRLFRGQKGLIEGSRAISSVPSEHLDLGSHRGRLLIEATIVSPPST